MAAEENVQFSFVQWNPQKSSYSFRWWAVFLFTVSTVFQTHIPVICIATCCLALCGLPAYISPPQKRTPAASLSSLGKDTPCKFHDHSMLLLPILHSDSDSLGHPRKLTAFIFYGAAFVSFWQCQWKIQGDALSYGSSQLMRPAAGRWREAGCRLTSRQTTVAAKIAAREVLMVCCQGDKDQPGSVSFADANEASVLLLTLA